MSLIAITPYDHYRQIIFATYRNTLKYQNISHNNKVAGFIKGEFSNSEGMNDNVVMTIIGHAEEINTDWNEAPCRAHLKQHPEMESFMHSSDCSLIRVVPRSYQVVYGLDDSRWITAEELDAV